MEAILENTDLHTVVESPRAIAMTGDEMKKKFPPEGEDASVRIGEVPFDWKFCRKNDRAKEVYRKTRPTLSRGLQVRNCYSLSDGRFHYFPSDTLVVLVP